MSSKDLVEKSEKPFWLQPPWMILFDIIRLYRVKPWDVNLAHLLTTLLAEMRRRGYIDFSASGVALLSSATIYRMKTELILKMEAPPTPPPVSKLQEDLPPPIQLPFRYEYTSTTIEQLLDSLEETLKLEPAAMEKLKLQPITPPPPSIPELDKFIVEIEEQIERMYSKIVSMIEGKKYIAFSEIATGIKRLEIVRAFIILLFLACRGKLQLWQEEEFGEIYVSLTEGGLDVDRATTTGIV